MYLEFFGLRNAPFRITPDTDFWFPGAQRGEILDALIYALSHGEGLVKVVGEVGSGKTMLLRMLLTRLPDTVDSLYLANPTLSPDEILATLLTELGAKTKANASRQAMLDQLNKLLLDKHQQGRRVVAFVEEAQAMSLESLEFLRLLTNLETARDKLLQIILFGQPELDELLANPRIRQLKDRITLNLNLDPLPARTIPLYLRSRLNTAGYRGPDLFDDPTTRAIIRYSGGLIRRINILADKALLAAYGEQTHNVSPAHIVAAAKDAELTAVSSKASLQWEWLSAGAAAGLGLIAFLAWLGLGKTPPFPPQAAMPASQAALLATASASPLSPTASSPASLPQQTLEWLASADPGTLVIQVDTAKDEAEASVLIKGLNTMTLPLPLRTFPAQTPRGKAWLVVAGEFKARPQAETALANLPESLRARQPFLRTVGKIRKTLINPSLKVPKVPS